ncbi:MAG TPA: TraB/GumN family protein [Qipengyuania sp.]|nr:TraB/GumN family protein [Qipengyuania sp.]
MNKLRFRAAALAGGFALALSSCAAAKDVPPPAPAAVAQPAGPALWKVADADTTIYLFGTVHALPKDVEWFRGPIAQALSSAQVLVTEIPPGALKQPEVQQAFMAKAMLPEGQTLRGLLNAEQRATFEGAMVKLGLPAEAFDKVEPWFAAITLATIPMLKAGYSLEAGAETAVEAKAGTGIKRDALETVEEQLALFDEMPVAVQTAYLVSVAEQMDEVVPSMNAMVTAWAMGDAEGLAKLMNDELDDPVLADRLLYARNRDWADWVEARLADPGTVFVAVGAGHLAGAKSVQDYLGKEGVAVTRVQ